jgi:hypothetical protein
MSEAVPVAAEPRSISVPGKLLRDPLLMFLAIGALLFGVYWALNDSGDAIIVDAALQEALASEYQVMTGRSPDAAARQKLIDDYVAEEILFREAITRGMHLTDRATKARLVDRLRFQIAGSPPVPSEADMLDFYSTHPELYSAEPQISLDQVYFAKSPEEPQAVLAALKAGQTIAGDDFWMGKRFPNYGESMLRGMFGEEMLKLARTAEPGQWVGPVTSPRGVHFLRVEKRATPGLIRYTDIRDQVRQDLLATQSNAAVDKELSRIKASYDVRIAN